LKEETLLNAPEKKSPTEPLDVQQKIDGTLARQRPVHERYPFFAPDYQLPFPHIGTEKQLFLDNVMLDHLDGVERIFPPPYRPEEPVLHIGDLPWEQGVPHAVSALYDPDDRTFKLWYSDGDSEDQFRSLYYAESTDALHWEKPLSAACLPYQQRTATNIVLQDTTGESVVLNPDRSDPNRKFLLVYSPPQRARREGKPFMTTVAASPDGLRWTTISEDTPYRLHAFPRIIWDEAIQKWIAYGQYSPHWNFLQRKRQIGRQESADFITWSPREIVLSSDWDPTLSPDIEFHDMSIRKVGGLYIGIVGEFPVDPIWTVNGRQQYNNRDHAYVRCALYCSRDGRRWQRVGGPGPWADNRKPDGIDAGWAVYTVADALCHDGKMIILYSAYRHKQHWFEQGQPAPESLKRFVPEDRFAEEQRAWKALRALLPRDEGGHIAALILREDGWAELRPTYERGRVYTKQFVFEGDALRINATCHHGYIRVEILDPYFNPYEGFSADECDPVRTDDPDRIWHRVTWQGHGDVRALWNKPCRLCFHVHQASLYAFQFVNGDGSPV
jgi:hypothetical protein